MRLAVNQDSETNSTTLPSSQPSSPVSYPAVAETRRWRWLGARQCVLGLVVAALLAHNLIAVPVSITTSWTEPGVIQRSPILTNTAPPPPLWDAWSANATRCYFFDNVCHAAQRWFYAPTVTRRRRRRQRVVVELGQAYANVGYGSQMVIDHLSNRSIFASLHCQESSIPNHLVLFSSFNSMLGEFYDRGLLGLWSTMSWLFAQQDGVDPEAFVHSFLRTQQLYLHLDEPARGLLESHSVFTSVFRSHPLFDLTKLLQESSCHCLPRLALCGYFDKLSTFGKDDNDTNNNQPLVLQPRGIPRRKRIDHQLPQQFRSLLREQMINTNTFVQQDIADYRKSVLADLLKTNESVDDWKIVGLTQRSSRRIWENFDRVTSRLRERFLPHRIAIVRINVEDRDWTSHAHLVRHAALDALIGVHGAQLTEAIWMKPNALVVELLPYVPDHGWGTWVRSTDAPTPLGDIFVQTDLQHVGVPLTVDSVPYCFLVPNRPDCWRTDETFIEWDVRGFWVDPELVLNVVQKMMVLPAQQPAMTCDDYVRAANNEMVLYNINCPEVEHGERSAHHFYWKK